METIQIYLNSRTANKYIGGFTSNCIFDLPRIIIPNNKKIHLSVLNASIPYSFFNVDYFNNLLVYSLGSGEDISIFIPEGNYNVNTLRNFLLSVMTGFTITYTSLNNSYTFSHPTENFSFRENSTCFEILGFEEDVEHTSTDRVLISTNSINLFTIRNIYIQSNNLMNNNINNATPNSSTILTSIPVSSGQNSIVNYYNFNNVKSRINDATLKNLSSLSIKLTDQDLDILDLNGCHFSLTLLIEYE
jgi:hypothetical protein